MRQKERVATLGKFKSNIIKILISTDVASRGLDIPNVQLVLNHRLPKFANEYVHRVGRTARQGRSGLAISIFRFPRDLEFLAEIESLINVKLTEHPLDQRLVERIFMQVSMAMHEAESKVDNTDFDERIQNYRRKRWMENGLDPDEQEAKWQKELKRKIKERKAARKEVMSREKVTPEIVKDERFKNVEVKEKKKFDRKLKDHKKVKVDKNVLFTNKKKKLKKV